MKATGLRIVLIIFVVIACLADLSAAEETGRLTAQQERILKAINFVRLQQNKPVLTWKDTYVSRTELSTALRDSQVTAGGFIAGRLHNIEPHLLAQATVVAWTVDSTEGGVGFATVGRDGRYVIRDLEPGDYYVLAVAAGFVPKFYDNVLNFYQATPVAVTDIQRVDGIDFDMEQEPPGTASIFGTVTHEGDGHPLAEVEINVFSQENPFLFGRGRTADDGTYRVAGLKSGDYIAQAFSPDYLPEYYDDAEVLSGATVISVNEPDEVGPIDFALSSGGMISGQVSNEDGGPITGAYVEALPVNWFDGGPDSSRTERWGSAWTDEDGRYRIAGLQATDYYVHVQVRTEWMVESVWYDGVSSIEQATPVTVELEQETGDIDFELFIPAADGEITGRVSDTNGDAVAGVFVAAHFQTDSLGDPGTFVAHDVTDSSGLYIIDGLITGNYLVQASYSQGWQFVQRWWPDAENRAEAEPIAVDGQTQAEFFLPIAPATAVISGRVLNAENNLPLAHAWIEISPAQVDPTGDVSGVWAYANSDEDGFYSIRGLPAGEYVAQAQYWQHDSLAHQWYDHVDSRDAATVLDIADNDTLTDIDFDLTLRPYFGDIAGTVVYEESGEPAARAYIEITPLYHRMLAAPFAPYPFYAITDENGHYQLNGLPDGEYIVAVYANGSFEYFEDAVSAENAISVIVIGGETSEVDFSLVRRDDGPGIISGQVYDEHHDGLLEIAVVTARPTAGVLSYPESEMFYTAVIDADGRYELSGLPTGEYYVMGFAPGYIGEYYDSVFDPAEATAVPVDGENLTGGIDFSLMAGPVFRLGGPHDTPRSHGALVTGQVSDAESRPLTNAMIHVLNEDDQPVAFGRTGADGRYDISALTPGRYRLRASRPGYRSTFHDGATSGAGASLLDIGGGNLEIDFTLAPVSPTDVSDSDEAALPRDLVLYGNYPNPFNPETRIRFSLPEEMQVKVTIYNLLGRKVRELSDEVMPAGAHHIIWDGRDRNGRPVTSGVYFYVLQAGQHAVQVQKMTLLK